jgi:hypothetical protein
MHLSRRDVYMITLSMRNPAAAQKEKAGSLHQA